MRTFADRIADERHHQRTRWGDAHDVQHTASEWVAIFAIYLGKLSAAIFKGDEAQVDRRIVQIAAIAQAASEAREKSL